MAVAEVSTSPVGPRVRADHIGSLIRPAYLIEAHRSALLGNADVALRQMQDRAIKEIVAMQEEVGLQSITDGEFRRTAYLTEFYRSIGVTVLPRQSTDLFWRNDSGDRYPGNRTEVKHKIRWSGSINVEALEFLRSRTSRDCKVTIPAPTQIHFFAGTDGIDSSVYPDLDLFWSDVVEAYAAELDALERAGCSVVQLDETCFPKFADPEIQTVLKNRGQEWKGILRQYTKVLNAILAAAPPSMNVVIHHCRGNAGEYWQARSGYDLVADIMFGEINCRTYLLEFDSERTGSFEPLRLLPPNKSAVLGLVSTKLPRLETVDELLVRVERAAKFVDVNRLGISPQCGFSSGFDRPALTTDIQRAKLEILVRAAQKIWRDS
jgi:5-methyltetrahydropteroyltriglutamate--homocysteine methyltransferase